MITRTFNTPEELMISLLQGEKWMLQDGVICFYDKDSSEPFRIKDWVQSKKITSSYRYCDGKTLWHKVEEKTELDLMKEKYKSGDYICISYISDKWETNKYPVFIEIGSYKLIHKKHKVILDTFLADNDVEIEIKCKNINCEWEWAATDFIKNYDETFEYQLKPKKKTVSIIKFYSTKGKVLEMDKSKLTQIPKNIIDEYEIEVYDE